MSDRIPTLADVCSAIAEGRLPVASDGSMYQVNVFELRRYFNKLHTIPAIVFLDSILTTTYPDSNDATSHDRYSFGC
jgi:hypothetical protein